MSAPGIVSRWQSFAPHFQAALRVAAAFMFMQAGSMKLLGFPGSVPEGTPEITLLSQLGIGALLELAGGALMLAGLYTRPVAFLLSGEMAVAYFQFHFPHDFWPVVNNGTPAVLYCFVWLWFSAAGAGAWSLDAWRARRRAAAG